MVSVRIITVRQLSSSSVKNALSESKEDNLKTSFRYEDDDAATAVSTSSNPSEFFSSSDLLLEAPVSTSTVDSESVAVTEVVSAAVVPSAAAPRKQVRFGSLQIHEHVMELGGSGIPRAGGAPVTLGWERQAHYEVAVEEYDDLKTHSRTGEELLLRKQDRVDFLLGNGFTMREINDATAQADVIRASRAVSFRQSCSKISKIKSALKNVIRRR